VLGRALAEDGDGRRRLWLKATLLHPDAATADLLPLLDLVTAAADRAAADHAAAEAPTAEDTDAPLAERLSP
ncbi:L-2,4-diaminobutyrate decarboxylase, partial [Streptomyces sp. OspMP-M43]